MKINIEKIKNYNQAILAICGSIGMLILLIALIMMIKEALPRNYNRNPNGLISEEKLETLNQENLRKQLISYDFPWLIDTLKSVYIVPVSIKTLKKAEKSEMGLYAISKVEADDTFSGNKRKGYYNSKSFYGEYANLIVYNPIENKTISLFNERIIIGGVQTYYFKDDILLVFFIASKDTDKNSIINLNDLRTLCIYSMNTGTIKKISDNDNQPENYQFVENSKDLLIEFQLSQHKEKQFDDEQIPRKIMKYTYDTQTLTNIIPEKIQNNMQKLVEGK
ncbi:MAG: hypothetical protein LBN27_09510 [Prevotellaceae bacterium]|jgi:hypothetical protein|nr:hypothetical protein [Prevotellaceae bacterium]